MGRSCSVVSISTGSNVTLRCGQIIRTFLKSREVRLILVVQRTTVCALLMAQKNHSSELDFGATDPGVMCKKEHFIAYICQKIHVIMTTIKIKF